VIASIALALVATVFAVATVLLLMLLVDVLVRRADVTAVLLIGSTLVDAFFAREVPSLTLPGDIRVGSTDVVATLVLCAAFARLLRMRRLNAYQRWLVVFVVLLFLSLARGIVAFGMQTSVNDFRLMEFWMAAVVYFATVPPSARLYNRIATLWVWMSLPLLAVVVARWLAIFTGIDVGVPEERFGADAAIRVLDGPYTFFLAQAFVLTLPFWRQNQGGRAIRVLSVALLLFVVVLDRRTAWVALLAGIIALSLHDRWLGRRAMWACLTAVGVVLGGYAAVGTATTGGVPIARAASETGSLAWRLEGWSILLSEWAGSPMNWFMGQPFGAGYIRLVEGSEVLAHPHNFYIEMLLRTGALGLLALLALTFGLLVATWRISTEDAGVFGSGVLSALLMMQVIWYVAWVPGLEQGIVTGIAISLTARLTTYRPPLVAAGLDGGRSTQRTGVRERPGSGLAVRARRRAAA
jgi:O-Antigen ligase